MNIKYDKHIPLDISIKRDYSNQVSSPFAARPIPFRQGSYLIQKGNIAVTYVHYKGMWFARNINKSVFDHPLPVCLSEYEYRLLNKMYKYLSKKYKMVVVQYELEKEMRDLLRATRLFRYKLNKEINS